MAFTHQSRLWVENVLICDEMVSHWGEGRNNFIGGSSTRNQCIERLWRDVFRCVCPFFYYTFYAMEMSGILNIENPIDMFALHLVFTRRINKALDDFVAIFNNHRLSTEHNSTPNQIWVNAMLDDDHPLNANNGMDEPVVDQFYGEDPHGPRPEPDDHAVIVEPVEISNSHEITNYLLSQVTVDKPSSQAGIDTYCQILQLTVHKLEDYVND